MPVFLVDGGEHGEMLVGIEDRSRVRPESYHNAATSNRAGMAGELADNLPVPQMHAVERADSDNWLVDIQIAE